MDFLQTFTSCLGSVQQSINCTDLTWQALLGPKLVTIGERSFEIMQQIGEGGYSFVYQVQETGTGEIYALKKVLLGDQEQVRLAHREVEMLKTLDHPNLLPLLHSSVEVNPDRTTESRQVLYMLFPLYETSLFAAVMKSREDSHPMTSVEILQIFLQVCRGLQAMHSSQPPLAHRDIKVTCIPFTRLPSALPTPVPQNILLKRAHRDQQPGPAVMERNAEQSQISLTSGPKKARLWTAAITDFGSTVQARIQISTRQEAVQLQEEAEAHCSAPYRAPELFDVASSCQMDERIDVWSLGCVLYFCLYGTSPFERDLGASLSLAIQNGKVEWPQSSSATAELKEMVQYCLNLISAERPSIEEVLRKAENLNGEGPK